MDSSSESSKPQQPKPKPIDRWLWSLGGVMAILFYLLPKTPPIVVVCVLALFVFLIHPVRNFWWIEGYRGRQIFFTGLLAIGCLLIGYVAWPEPPKEIAAKDGAAQPDSFVQVGRFGLSDDTVVPFQAGQRIALNFGVRNTGRVAASNVHIHSRAGFIRGGLEAEEQGVNRLFNAVYQEILDFYAHHQEGQPLTPNTPMTNYFSVAIDAPSKREIEEFNNNKLGIYAVMRIEYDYTHYQELCVMFASDSVQEFLQTKHMHFNNCHIHNRVGLHPIGRLE